VNCVTVVAYGAKPADPSACGRRTPTTPGDRSPGVGSPSRWRWPRLRWPRPTTCVRA